jgi:hypothetical protein
MKTLFSFGFQSYDPFTSYHPALGQTSEFEHIADAEAQNSAQAQAQAQLDAAAQAAQKDMISKINAGNSKWAAVRAWIASRIDADPMLQKTLTGGDSSQQYVVDNFWGYDDLINKDQYYADLAMRQIAAGQPPSDDTAGRVDEWAKVIDIMTSVMQQYGGRPVGTPLPVKMGPTTTTPSTTLGPINTTTPRAISPTTGKPLPTTIAPGATIQTPPPASTIAGIPTKTLLWGGAAILAAIGIAAVVKSR